MKVGSKIINMAYRIGMTQEREEIEKLAQFVYELNPKNIMEIGTKLGGTFYLWCKLSKRGSKRISIDLPGGQFGGWILKYHPYLGHVFKARELYFRREFKNTHMILGNSHSKETAAAVAETLRDQQIDFLFIDGDHTYEGVKNDYLMYKKFVSEDGYIAFHDINDTPHHRKIGVFVGKFWKELPKRKKVAIFDNGTQYAGIGVINNK